MTERHKEGREFASSQPAENLVPEKPETRVIKGKNKKTRVVRIVPHEPLHLKRKNK